MAVEVPEITPRSLLRFPTLFFRRSSQVTLR